MNIDVKFTCLLAYVYGTYLYLVMCIICFFNVVEMIRTIQEINRIGQNTGLSNALKNISTTAMHNASVSEYLIIANLTAYPGSN